MINQIYNPRIIVWSNLVSKFLSPIYLFFNLFRKTYSITDIDIKTILITEFHRIGDILIIAPALKNIKQAFPNAHLILICNKASADLAKDLNLANEIIPIAVPWTDWNWSLIKWWKARSFAKKISYKNIDIAFDFKGDLRNSWFLWKTKPKVSFGYDTTGGGYFFTHPNKMNQNLHQTDRAKELVAKIGCSDIFESPKKLKNNNGAVVFHIGASDPSRLWPLEHWSELAKLLSENYLIGLVKTPESHYLEKKIDAMNLNVEYFEGSLVELKNWLKHQKCLISPDSMAGHLAAYIGLPTVSIFGSQLPRLTCPLNDDHGVVIKPPKKCNHIRNHWRFCGQCMESVVPESVFIEVNLLLS